MSDKKTLDWTDLDKFKDVGTRLPSKTPTIRLNKNRSFAFSKSFQRAAEDQLKEYVIFSYSKSNKAIVLEFTEDNNVPGVVKLSGGSSTKYVAARSFFNYYQLDAEKYQGRYTPELIEIPGKGKLWVIFLTEDVDGEKNRKQ